jgi:hypothetical protein
MGVVSEVLKSLEHAKAHSSGEDLDSLRLVLENSRDVLSMYVRLNEEKTAVPGDVRPKVNELFGGIGGTIKELDRILHLYDAGRMAYQEMLDYKKILEEDPNRLADVLTDQHLRTEIGDMLQPKQAFYRIRDIVKTNAEKIGPSKGKLVSQLTDLENALAKFTHSVAESAKTMAVLAPMLVGGGIIASQFRNTAQSGTALATTITEPVTLASLTVTVGIVIFFVAYFKNFFKIQRRF